MQVSMVSGGTLHANSGCSNTLHRGVGIYDDIYQEKKKKREKRTKDGQGKRDRSKGVSNPSKGNIFQ